MSGHIIRSRLTNIDTWKPAPGRLVHAARARKLRRRGEAVKFVGYTVNGKAAYEWTPAPKRQPYQNALFAMLQKFEDLHTDEGGEIMQLAQKRTAPFMKPRVFVASTPNRPRETVSQWAERMLGKPYEATRQTGITTKQMVEAPKGAWFVWPTSGLSYPAKLARRLGRQDLRIVQMLHLSPGWVYCTTGDVVIDHACSSHARVCSDTYGDVYSEVRAMLRQRGRLID